MPSWLELHPFLEHYQSDDDGDGMCAPTGSSGSWWAASGASEGYEQWRFDLGAYATRTVELSITYASDESVQFSGAFVDDIVVSTGAGTTSFEADGNTFDGWTVPGAPDGSPPNPNDWIAGTTADTPPPLGPAIDAAFARQGEILDFEESLFGRYPFSAAGGIVDDTSVISFALENQTRPIYAKGFFSDPLQADSVVCTSWPTSGTATASPSRGGSTSGSTRGSRRMRSGSGASVRGSGPHRRSSTSSTT